MAPSPENVVVLDLHRVDELFDAPPINPFSTRAIEIFGEAGMEHLHKRIVYRWPRKPRSSRLILQLPADQISPRTASEVSAAIRRFCAAQIERNRARRRHAIAAGLRQLALACMILLFDVVLLYLLATRPVGLLPGPWRNILVVLAVFAGLVALWDAFRSLGFDWIPFVQEDAGYRYLSLLDVIVEPRIAEAGD